MTSSETTEDVKPMEKIASLGAAIVKKAEGVFLWVALVLRAVEEGIVAGDTVEELEAKIDFLSLARSRISFGPYLSR
jgi:hypothetical protein